MLNITTTSKLTQLPVNKLKIVDENVIPGTNKEIIEFTLAWKGKYILCPYCGYKTKKRYDNAIYYQNNIRHMISFKYDINLKLQKRRFCCKNCQRDFLEQFPFVPYTIKNEKIRSKGHTKQFEEYILFEWHQLSVAEIARRCNVSEFRIWRVIEELDLKTLERKGIQHMLEYEGDLFLGIDEHSFSGRDMVLVIAEHSTKKVVAVLKDVKKETLKRWLNNLPPKVMKKIKGLTIDMTNGYKNTVLKTLGAHIVDIVDKFHIIKLANNVLNEVRQLNNWMMQTGYYGKNLIDIKAKKALKKKSAGNNITLSWKYRPPETLENIKKYQKYMPFSPEYIPITTAYYLDQKYTTLFLLGEEKLTTKQKHRLNQIFREFDPKGYMFEAYNAKETIREILDTKDKQLLDELLKTLKDSEHYKIQEYYRTLKRWHQSILNYFEYGLTNARLEGKNTKAKLLKRISYGYNTKRNYMKKLMFAC